MADPALSNSLALLWSSFSTGAKLQVSIFVQGNTFHSAPPRFAREEQGHEPGALVYQAAMLRCVSIHPLGVSLLVYCPHMSSHGEDCKKKAVGRE